MKIEPKMELKHEPIKQVAIKHSMTAPPVTPFGNIKPAPALANVTRTLFTDGKLQVLGTSYVARTFLTDGKLEV